MKTESHRKATIETYIPVNTLICDNCRQETTNNGEVSYGGNWAGGWYHLQREIRGTYIEELQKPSNWDFCSIKCLQEYTQSLNLD
jgi:hypothetical protein